MKRNDKENPERDKRQQVQQGVERFTVQKQHELNKYKKNAHQGVQNTQPFDCKNKKYLDWLCIDDQSGACR